MVFITETALHDRDKVDDFVEGGAEDLGVEELVDRVVDGWVAKGAGFLTIDDSNMVLSIKMVGLLRNQ